jgi:hypothetical protein
MRKIYVIIIMIALVSACAYSDVQMNQFESAFKDFASDMAGSLDVNSTIGANWSDAYVGNFPHFGLGLTAGATTVSPSTSKDLFTSMGASVPSGINSIGIPIPATVATFKIGLPVLPMDLGFKLGFVPASVVKSMMGSSGSDFTYLNYGVQLRYALVKQKGLLPNVSIGAAYDHVNGEVTVPTNLGSQTYTFSPSSYYITASNPKMDVSWKSNTFDFTAQVSKKFFILVPYLGAGLTFGKSEVDGGVDSSINTNYPGGVSALKNYLNSLGYSVPDDMSNSGFSYTADETNPLFRLYGGMSFRLFVIDLDLQGIYLLQSKSFGASLTGRFQI